MKKTIVLILTLAICLSLCACGGETPAPTEITTVPTEPPTEPPTEAPTLSPEELAAQEAAAFHEKMAAVLDAEEIGCVTDHKAVALCVEDSEAETGTYSDKYIPESLLAQSGEEVLYIVRCRDYNEKVGFYLGVGGGGTAYCRHVSVKIINVLTGDTVATESFAGGDPPDTISAGTDGYGSYPDEGPITEWILSVIQADIAEQPEKALSSAKNHTEFNSLYSRKRLIETLCRQYALPDATYAADNIGLDWNEQAVLAAKNLLERNPFTYSELLLALQDPNGFTEEEAKYGVDNCGADWDKQAQLLAEEWLSQEEGCSYKTLVNNLVTYNAMSPEDAQHVADNCGADWNAQALKAARYMLALEIGFSPSSLLDWLTDDEYGDGFTLAEAQYAVDNCGADWFQQAVYHVAGFLEESDYEYTKESMVEEMVLYYGFTEEQAIYGAEQNGLT